MTDESESGETYDKIAYQIPVLTPKRSRPRRRDELDPMLEAKLVRAVMSKQTTADHLARELRLDPSVLQYHLKRLGLDSLVPTKASTRKRQTRRLKRIRSTLAH